MKKIFVMLLVLLTVWGMVACTVEPMTTTETQEEIMSTYDTSDFEEQKKEWYYGWGDARWIEYVDSSVPELKTRDAHPDTIWEA